MSAQNADKRAFTIDDFARIRTIQEVRMAPDSGRVAFAVQSMNLEKNRFDGDIFLVPSSGGDPVQITDGGQNGNPRWSPDGRWIAFVQNIEGKRSLWLTDPEGSNRVKIADFDLSNASLGPVGESLCWSPDGTQIAFLASIEPANKEEKIKVITRLMYKAFYGYSDMRRRHVFTVSSLGHEPPRQITYGDFDEHSISWSPEGKEIAFISNRTGKDDLNMQTDIWAVDVKSKKIRRITKTRGAEYEPAWSPDGSKLAYLARKRGNTSNESTPEDAHVWIINSDGSDPRDLTAELDRTCTAPQWAPEGDRILFTASDRGRVNLYSVTLDGKTLMNVTKGDRTITKISVAQEKQRIAYVSDDPRDPGELYSSNLEGNGETKLTDLNGFLREINLSTPEEFILRSFDGTELQGWILKPKDFDSSKKYPALLNIKGGPSGQRGYSFNTYHQIGPANGYVQFHVNYRGSSGYGQAFSDASVGDMLGGDYRDNMAAVDHVVSTAKYVNEKKMGVWGGSYGGYLTNWIVTQTDRFKAAVSISSISNLFTQWGASAIPLWLEVEIEGLPWDRMDLMFKQSPIMQANKVKTPVLFLHGEMDFDTPIVEAEQMFMALKKIGVETTMIRYVDDGHGIRIKPVNQLDALRRAIAWFDKYLKTN